MNVDYVARFIGDAHIVLEGGEDGYEELGVTVRESIKAKLTDWRCANGYYSVLRGHSSDAVLNCTF
jgi:hypothetical protein